MGGVLSVLFFHGFTKKKKSLRLAVAARSAAGKSSQPLWNVCVRAEMIFTYTYNSLNLFLYYLHEWINDRGRVGELIYKNLFDNKSNEK